MVDDLCLQNLLSSVVNEKFYSHCRLCLREICDKFVRFDDNLPIDEDNMLFKSLSDVLNKLFGDEISQEISGIDGVCIDCADQAIQAFKFIEKCNNATKLLHSVFDNVSAALNVDIETSIKQNMFVIVGSAESKIILVKNEAEKTQKEMVQKVKICLECNKLFDDIIQFKMHNLTYHSLFTCEKCLETFEHEMEQIDHNESIQMYSCDHCNDYYCTEDSLKKHKLNLHSTHICKICGKSIKGLQKLKNHEKKHSVKSTCEKCGKSYATKSSYLKHIELCLEDKLVKHPIRSNLVRNYVCKLCGKGYSTPSGLRVHERFVHGNAKPHVCEYCNKKFTAPSYLKVHMVKHTGAKNYACDLCNGKFGSKEALLYHTRRHTGERPYSCHLCDQRFVNASARAEHIKFKHVGPTLMCEVCPRKFVTPTFLRLHMQKHHDPTSKLFAPRTIMPANIPGGDNMRIRLNQNQDDHIIA
ncbi:hypothetical protein K1T71_014011 [Dendrolimus kikuchii]|uniref:Uncharacterized protein n=1 Tax=Dendrolimus kikuchii TaxID=765133 RepID=A0ACC1CGD3_9NEOP|nr:hypothetical protein K1T71_014011 [Dendrolimus kikuchii]